ncbi:PspA/IM30 family protein [Nocardia shimofusensis]|uniref:PspA/IM30 family protein n=1 Tax=Nocardia shimofusensis TaxID=228596 RepID=UPI00082B2D2B|nr:hypothetical protein [Nocardia shimofusensis]
MDKDQILAGLAALPDDELAAVLRAAVAGRPAFHAVQAALAGMADAPGREGQEGLADHETIPRGDGPGDVTSTTTRPVGDPPGSVSDLVGGPVFAGSPDFPVSTASGYTSSGVPTFDSVRDKVDRRSGTAQGMSELDRQTPAGRSVDEQFAAREQAARERLDRIRRSLHGEDTD